MTQLPHDETMIPAPQISALYVPELIDVLHQRISENWLLDPATDVVVGIQRGGAIIAERIHQKLSEQNGLTTPLGTLDINLYRDDFDQRGMGTGVPNNLPFSIDGRRVLMIDDVLYSGRSCRAAINILFDYGRPQSIQMAVLLDRGGRELPFAADFTAISTYLEPTQRVKMDLVEPYSLSLIDGPVPNRGR